MTTFFIYSFAASLTGSLTASFFGEGGGGEGEEDLFFAFPFPPFPFPLAG